MTDESPFPQFHFPATGTTVKVKPVPKKEEAQPQQLDPLLIMAVELAKIRMLLEHRWAPKPKPKKKPKR